MKKILSLILSVLMICSACALAGCGAAEPAEEKAAANLKFGAGAVGALSTADATEKKGALGTLELTYAAVLVDADGKITACALDAMKMETEWKDGKFAPVQDKDLKSKYEQKDQYAMTNYNTGAQTTWVMNADALEKLIVGKTLDQAKALVAEGGKGTEEVQKAGCSIAISDLIKAVENAYNNAKTEVAADATLSIAGHGTQEIVEIIAKYEGQNKLEAYMTAAAKDKDGKILAISSDCMNADFRANEGKVEMVQCSPNQTKRQQGDNYNMVNFGGAKAEWYAQADSFDKACIGKTAAEIAAITAEAAGCTISVDGLVAAASKL